MNVSDPVPGPLDSTATLPPVPPEHEHDHDHEHERHRGTDVQVEKPRTHPLTYAAIALSTLALLFSVAALSRDDDGGGYREVRIGNNDCIIGENETASEGDDPDQAALFCRTASVP